MRRKGPVGGGKRITSEENVIKVHDRPEENVTVKPVILHNYHSLKSRKNKYSVRASWLLDIMVS